MREKLNPNLGVKVIETTAEGMLASGAVLAQYVNAEETTQLAIAITDAVEAYPGRKTNGTIMAALGALWVATWTAHKKLFREPGASPPASPVVKA